MLSKWLFNVCLFVVIEGFLGVWEFFVDFGEFIIEYLFRLEGFGIVVVDGWVYVVF